MTTHDWLAATGFVTIIGFVLVAVFLAFFTGGNDD